MTGFRAALLGALPFFSFAAWGGNCQLLVSEKDWVLTFDGGKRLTASEAEKVGVYREVVEGTVRKHLWTTAEAEVEIAVTPSDDGGMAYRARIKPFAATADGFEFPAKGRFAPEMVKRFLFPASGVNSTGLALNERYFRCQPDGRYLVHSVPYPPLFADWVRLERKDGSCVQLFGLQPRPHVEPWKNPVPFRPARVTVGADKEGGFYSHRYEMWTSAGAMETLPEIRVTCGGTVDESLAAYLAANRLGRTLADKASVHPDPDFLRKLSAAPMFLMGGNAAQVKSAMDAVPVPTLLHHHTYMQYGFDHGNPDFLPPNKGFGTSGEFRDLLDFAHARGHLFSPYTNPCWWCDDPMPETFAKAGMEPVAKKRDGSPLLSGPWRSPSWRPAPGTARCA